MKMVASLAILLVSTILATASARAADEVDFPITSYKEALVLFEKLNYTPKAWQSGVRAVPRVYLTTVPARWRGANSQKVTVLQKKQIFFRVLAPLALRSNEMITADRERLLRLATQNERSEADKAWLAELATRYRLAGEKSGVENPDFREAIEELKRRVDVIPVSLALAQAAEESGWGTSRFADLGNAVFGQWTWGGKGIVPEQQRAGKGDYKVAAYDTLFESVQAYMLNINTSGAYADLRQRRAEMRTAGEPLTGWKLAETLTRYSERGAAYVTSLHGLMKTNRLEPTDAAHFAEGPAYILRPVGEGAE